MINTLSAEPLENREQGLPPGWTFIPFEEVIEQTQYGLSIRGEQTGQYPILRMNCLNDGEVQFTNLQYVNLSDEQFSTFKLNRGDLLFNRTNSQDLVGKTGLFDSDKGFVFASYLIRVVLRCDKVIPEFMNYYLNYAPTLARLRAMASRGVSQSNINASKLKSLPVLQPLLPEQRAIAATLRAVQDAREARRRELALERERKAALMEELFTCGVRGEPCKQTEIGMIPQSWEVLPFGQVMMQSQYGLSVRGEQAGQYPILRMNCLMDGKVAFAGLQYVNLPPNQFQAFKLNRGDLLFNRTNSQDLVGKTGMFDTGAECVFASYLVRVVLNSSKAAPAFLNFYLNYPPTLTRLRAMASRGVSQSNINASKLKTLPIPLPKLDEQKDIAEALTACDQKIAALEAEAALHDELFRALLEELMTGRLSALPLVEQEANHAGY